MEFHLFLYYCAFCQVHELPGKSYEDFFKDRELVAMAALSYFMFIRNAQ